jgi:NhaP-type Na+/H+ or K+/H+ antiporter
VTADWVYLVAGTSLLLAVVLPELLSRYAVSAPMVLVAVGMVIGATPLGDGVSLDPVQHLSLVEHVTELAVLVSLMGVGLALDRGLDLRSARSRRGWSATWRLLAVAMPLTIGGVALLGWALGLAPAVALLLGAVLSPTDPVLASDVQVAGPQTDQHEVDETDEVRFTLTSEAGLNDGLAFPFVYLAVIVAAEGLALDRTLEWVGWYLLAKVVIGVGAGFLTGRALAWLAFRAPSESLRTAETGDALLAVAALVTSYGVGEVAGGYGFLSVFVCAVTFRAQERSHDYHEALHQVVERLERLLVLFVLLLLGVALTRGLLEALDWRGVVVGLALVLVIRPAAALLALGWPRSHGRLGMTAGEAGATAFFGVRGVGSIFYLAHAAAEDEAFAADRLWSTVAFTIVVSVLVHGVLAKPVMTRVGRE